MTKNNLISTVSGGTGISERMISIVLDAVLDTVSEELCSGGDVNLGGFGRFAMKSRAQRIGRNPHTKEAVIIPARKIPSFVPGKCLMDATVCEVK